jgi:hypothetical protein
MNHPKFRLTRLETNWLKLNFKNYTTQQQFEYIMANRPKDKRACYTTFRTALYNKSIKKCKILRWSDQETQFLVDNYQSMGNIEIAQKLSTKKRPFTKKNVEKKIVLLNLKRTPEQRKFIIDQHKKTGKYSKASYKKWETMGSAADGEKRTWLINGAPKVVIKVNGVFVHYARHRFIQLHGSVLPGHKVYHKDGNPLNIEDDNLIQAPAGTCRMKDYKKHIQKLKDDRKLKVEKRVFVKQVQPPKHTPKGIAVRLDRKTVVFVKPGTNIETFKKQYENRPLI